MDCKQSNMQEQLEYLYTQISSQQLDNWRTHEIKNDRLCKYTKTYEKLKTEFQEVVLQKVPWEENKKADELTQMASAITQWVEDIVTRVKLVAQVIQILALNPNPSEEADWREGIISFLQ